jgi:hypothetical protein
LVQKADRTVFIFIGGKKVNKKIKQQDEACRLLAWKKFLTLKILK